ncbi:MAG: hypothetical protein AB7O04_07540 [Hyphomonadaceae bacterium]
MSVAADLIAAMDAETAKVAGAKTTLVSITLDALREGAPAAFEARITRKTKSFVFSEGEAKDAAGAALMAASAVHKIKEP